MTLAYLTLYTVSVKNFVYIRPFFTIEIAYIHIPIKRVNS